MMILRYLPLACALACTGPAGPQGPPGSDGTDGKDGQSCRAYDTAKGHVFTCDDGYGVTIHDGRTNEMLESFFCEGGLENTNLVASYDAVLFSNGDIWTTGSVSDPSRQSSASNFWDPSQNGYADAATGSIVFDFEGPANGGYFVISLDRTTLVSVVTYHDTDLPNDSEIWTMPPDKCVHNFYAND
jgi:hypothetical protein